jgi:hypothetical protein
MIVLNTSIQPGLMIIDPLPGRWAVSRAGTEGYHFMDTTTTGMSSASYGPNAMPDATGVSAGLSSVNSHIPGSTRQYSGKE